MLTKLLRALDRVFVFCASLRLAVASLSLLAAVLAAATFYEAAYGSEAAREMVYRAWWFTGLLGVLALNILAAAVIRFPWKRRQAGFVIAHAGLLIVLLGSVRGFQGSLRGLMPVAEGGASAHVRLDAEHFRLRYRTGEGAIETGVGVNLLREGVYPSFVRYIASPLLGAPPGAGAWPEGRVARFAAGADFTAAVGRVARIDVLDYHPAARRAGFSDSGAELYEPVELEPDKPPIPAARVRLTLGHESADLWLARDGEPRELLLSPSGTRVSLTYARDQQPLGFAVHLDRFERITDPGTMQAAEYISTVRIVDESAGVDRRHEVSMNQPIRYGGMTLYQSGFQAAPDGRGMVSVFAVNRDPGRPIKYAGCMLVVLGIVTMFVTRRFAARGAAATSPVPAGSPARPPADAAPEPRGRPVGNGAGVAVALLMMFGSQAAAASAEEPSPSRLSRPALHAVRAIPVMHEGRIKPLDTVARQTVRELTGQTRFGEPVDTGGRLAVPHKLDPAELLIAIMADPERWAGVPLIRVESAELRDWLGMQPGYSHISPRALTDHDRFGTRSRDLFAEAARAEASGVRFDPSGLERAILRVAAREGHFRAATRGMALGLLPYPHDEAFFDWLDSQHEAEAPVAAAREALWHWRSVPEWAEGSARHEAFLSRAGWMSLDALLSTPPDELPPPVAERWREVGRLWAGALEAYHDGAEPNEAIVRLAAGLDRLTGSEANEAGVRRELLYNRLAPLDAATVLYVAAAAALGLSLAFAAAYRVGIALLLGAVAFNVLGFYLRVWISGWAPVTSMYETVVWSALGVAVLGLAFATWHARPGRAREGAGAAGRLVVLGGAAAAATLAVIASAMPVEMGARIDNPQPVLRNNFWLSAHVLSIVSSYAAFALALALGNIALAIHAWSPRRKRMLEHLTRCIYRSIQVGVVLIALGTFLGAVWADLSWGRFWGWDPKEVWALVVLLVYVALLHGRFAGLVGPFGLAIGAVVGFMAVIMAWYGVNFVLGVGLHSYGFGDGGQRHVLAAAAAQGAFAAVAAGRVWRRRAPLEAGPRTVDTGIDQPRAAGDAPGA